MQGTFFLLTKTIFILMNQNNTLSFPPPVRGLRSPLLTEQLMKVEPLPAQPVKSGSQPHVAPFLDLKIKCFN